MSTDFGKRLKQARKAKKITQAKLAALVGMAQSTLAQAESTGFGSTWTPLWADALGVNALWLATGEGEMEMDKNSPPRQSANDGDGLTPLARSLGELFDTLPISDPDLRAKAFSRAADAILLLKTPPPSVLPTAEHPDSPQTPPATHRPPKVRSK